MSKFSLDPEMNFEIMARFIAKGSDAAVTGEDYKVRLYDRDIFDSDFIGQSGLNEEGCSKISFHHDAFGYLANLETFPDLYFVVYKNDMPIFKSQVMKDVDLLAIAI